MIPIIKNKSPKDTKIVVAMSGGVDSSVVAALLHEQGYEVIGITLQLFDYGQAVGKKGACCAGQDIHDARRVAEGLGIPHYVLDYENKFKESVIDDFVDTYLSGETPIPCVRCNQSVKFKDLLKTARELGADVLATGHYVQRIEDENGVSTMHKGVDKDKDQSYFLFATTREQLDFLRFPLGGMNKQATRKLADKYNLAVADKAESQDICFVPNGNYASVIEKIRPGALDKGDIIHVNGKKMGVHEGIINYTVGQRKGLGIAHPEPLFVIKLNADKKQVIVGEKSYLSHRWFAIREINWLSDVELSEPIKAQVRVRSMHNPLDATISKLDNEKLKITLDNPYEGISPGQACVIYDGTKVLGGGWICKDHLL